MKQLRTPLLLCALILAAGNLAAQESGVRPDPEAVARLLAEPLPPDFHLPGASPTEKRIEYHARDVRVHDVFAQIREITHRNIVVAPEVTATFSGDLFDLTAEEAIDLVCRSTGLQARDEGAFIFIAPAETGSRLYELEYARAEDVVSVLKPMLVEGATAAASTVAKVGIETSQTEAGGDSYAAAEVVVVTGPESFLEQADAVVATLDRRPRQVLLEATILSVQLSDSMAMGVDFHALGGVDFERWGVTSADGTSLSGGSISGSQLEQGVTAAGSSVSAGLPGGGLTAGVINGDVGVFLRALEQVANASILANPKIVTLNKQRGEVLLGRRDGYLTTTVTDTSSTQTVEFIETGTRLVYRPFISEDGLIRLEVHPEDSEGGLNANGLPFKETAEVTTNILLRDGETVAIGGLFREKVKSTASKVPVVGDLPFVGRLFRGVENSTVREEIIVLLTPHILDEEPAPPARSEFDLGVPRPVRAVYLQTARRLADGGLGGAALVLARVADGLTGISRPALALRGAISRSLVSGESTRPVDQQILRRLLVNLNDFGQEQS